MRKLEERLQKHIDLLVKRYPVLKSIEQSIIDAYLVMEECYENGGKLLIAGNGTPAPRLRRETHDLLFLS